MTDFKSALLTLADDAFFGLVRNYLGPVKTPFNKHDLIDRLIAFLRNEEIQERIIELVDNDDAELLTAISVLGEPDFDEIHLFFAGERSYLDLHQRLLNLEDRLLVYRAGEHLRINPVLARLLDERVIQPDLLFASRSLLPGESAGAPWLTDTLLVSFCAYLHEEPDVFRADGSLRKRALSDLNDRLPVLTEPTGLTGSRPRIAALVDTLTAAGAVVNDGGLHPVLEVWERLSEFPPLHRTVALVAAAACGGPVSDGPLLDAIVGVLTCLPCDRAVDALSIERLLLIAVPELGAETCRRLREQLTAVGMLVLIDDTHLAAAESQAAAAPQSAKPLIVQPNFDITMPEEFRFSDGLLIARMARLIRHDRYPHFELTKDRFAAALRSGLEVEEAITRLNALANDRVPQNVVVTMRSWAGEHESVRLFKGVVLTVEKSRRHAVEHSEPVRTLIRRELAPGVYFVDEHDVDALQAALAEAGIELVPEIVPQPRLLANAPRQEVSPSDPDRIRAFGRLFHPTSSPSTTQTRTRRPGPAGRCRPASDPGWRQEIDARLKNPSLSEEQRQELSGRVRQKLILSPDQVDPGALKSEKTEARGLDYVGKVRIIEQAIRTGMSLLEIIQRMEDGTPRRRLVEPLDLEKKGNELLLVGEELPERTRIELFVRKLGLVRRLRSGLVRRQARRQ